MVKIKTKKAYQIEWQDAYNGWHEWTDIEDMTKDLSEAKDICVVLLTGYCVYTDKNKVAIACNIYNGGAMLCDVMVIPRKMIIGVTELGERAEA